jgi:hypothetical protein
MKIIAKYPGFLAVAPFTGPKGRVQVAGWGNTRLEAMAACGDLVATLDSEVGR